MSAECYPGCPHPPCVEIRAAQPVAAAMQARHLSGASIGKLVEYEIGRDIVTSEHQWSQAFMLRGLTHTSDEVELEAHGSNYGLKPTDWVRVTRVAA